MNLLRRFGGMPNLKNRAPPGDFQMLRSRGSCFRSSIGPLSQTPETRAESTLSRQVMPVNDVVSQFRAYPKSNEANGRSGDGLRGVTEGTCPRAYHRPPGGRVRAFQSIRTI